MNPSPSALITGASRGIGQAIARALAARGVRIVVHYHQNRTAAEATRATLPGSGHALVQADLSLPAAAQQLWSAAESLAGPLSILVNNAGIYEDHPPLASTHDDWQRAWRRTLDANLLSPAQLAHLAANAFAARGGGRIVNIGSRGAFRGEPAAPAYAAAKAGLHALSQSLALALAPHGVFVFALAPGWVSTDMALPHLDGSAGDTIRAQHPLGRVTTPEEVAAACVFCALDAPAAMTGALLDINGASYLRT